MKVPLVARQVCGKVVRGASGKTIVFGLKKRDSKVYRQIVTNCSAKELLPIIKKKVPTQSTVFNDS